MEGHPADQYRRANRQSGLAVGLEQPQTKPWIVNIQGDHLSRQQRRGHRYRDR